MWLLLLASYEISSSSSTSSLLLYSRSSPNGHPCKQTALLTIAFTNPIFLNSHTTSVFLHSFIVASASYRHPFHALRISTHESFHCNHNFSPNDTRIYIASFPKAQSKNKVIKEIILNETYLTYSNYSKLMWVKPCKVKTWSIRWHWQDRWKNLL